MEIKKIGKRLTALLLLGAFWCMPLVGCTEKKEQDGADASASAAAGTGEPEKISGRIMIYTSAEDAFMTEVCAQFNKKYPDAQAEYYRSGTEEVISKLMAEKQVGSIQADLIMVSDAPTFETLKAAELLVSYDSPELANIYTEYVDPEHYYYGTFPAAMGIMYNTNLVDTPPKSWNDLLSGTAAGSTIMPNPLYSGTAANALLELTRADGLGWDYYQKLADKNVMIVNGNGGVVNSVASGENAYGIVVDSNALAAAQKGSPVAFVYPEEGVPATADPIGIVNGAKNPKGAQAFLDFMLQEEAQSLGRDLIGKMPIRKDITPPEGSVSLADRKLLLTDAKVLFAARENEKARFKEMFNQ